MQTGLPLSYIPQGTVEVVNEFSYYRYMVSSSWGIDAVISY